MKYRIISAIILVFTSAFFQSTILEIIEIFGVRPNLLIVLTVIISLLRSPVESGIMALSFGISMDLLMGKTIGWYGLLFFLVSIPISLINEKLYREKFLVLFSLTFVATITIETLFAFILFIFKDLSHMPYLFGTIVLPEALYNSILIFLLFRPIKKVYGLLDRIDRRRNRLSA
ncbi:MAG: rod shape-determining protein MreD [Acetivibrionales bacterium]|jgi:rod shape-determining protein MreD|nr:rod shape-determining protein MreD [Clostridiaceae bacterium]